MASALTLMGLTISAPDHTTVSRRAVKLPAIRPASVPRGPLHVLIDSTGLPGLLGGSMAGGETWRELHLAVDAGSGMIMAQTLTDQDADDPSRVAPLLDQIGGRIARVTADGASTYTNRPKF